MLKRSALNVVGYLNHKITKKSVISVENKMDLLHPTYTTCIMCGFLITNGCVIEHICDECKHKSHKEYDFTCVKCWLDKNKKDLV